MFELVPIINETSRAKMQGKKTNEGTWKLRNGEGQAKGGLTPKNGYHLVLPTVPSPLAR